jgi:hypothetical protein
MVDRILPLPETRCAHELSQGGPRAGKSSFESATETERRKGDSYDSWVQVFANSRRIREFFGIFAPQRNTIMRRLPS